MDRVSRLLEVKGNAIYAVPPESKVWETARVMAEKHIGAILVMKGEQVVGIFSERDLLTRVLLKGLDPKDSPVSEVMSTDMVYVTPETSVAEAMAVMTERRCRHLPVMHEGKLHGMVSIGDCTRWVSRDQEFTIKHLTDFIHNKYPG